MKHNEDGLKQHLIYKLGNSSFLLDVAAEYSSLIAPHPTENSTSSPLLRTFHHMKLEINVDAAAA